MPHRSVGAGKHRLLHSVIVFSTFVPADAPTATSPQSWRSDDRPLTPLPMRLSLRLLVVLGVVSLAALPAGAQGAASVPAVDTAQTRLIGELITVTHVVDNMLTVMKAGVVAQRQASPQIPGEFWDRFLAAATARRSELEEMVSQLYRKYYTADDLRQLLAFYGSPTGKKLLDVQPSITRDAMANAAEWGRQLGVEIATQMGADSTKKVP